MLGAIHLLVLLPVVWLLASGRLRVRPTPKTLRRWLLTLGATAALLSVVLALVWYPSEGAALLLSLGVEFATCGIVAAAGLPLLVRPAAEHPVQRR